MNLFNIGDKVRVIKYGHGTCENDLAPWLVGKFGLIDKVIQTQGEYRYSIHGIKQKHAWYDEGQLEMVSKNPNTL